MAPALCSIVENKRSLVAFLWTAVSTITAAGFVITLGVALSHDRRGDDYLDDRTNDGDGDGDNDEGESADQRGYYDASGSTVSVASRAMLFAFAWTGASSCSLSLVGSMLLGVVSPFSGELYSCCPSRVVRITPVSMGTFVGALLMYANLTLLCAVLFGQFNIRDRSFREDEQEGDEGRNNDVDNYYSFSEYAARRSSAAFSVLCLASTVSYAAFALVLCAHREDIMAEMAEEERAEALAPSPPALGDHHHHRHRPRPISLHPSGDHAYYVGGPLTGTVSEFLTTTSETHVATSTTATTGVV